MKSISRVTLSKTATGNLKQIAARTGISPNILARFAMLISFEQPIPPADDSGDPDLTIHQNSLFGELEPFLISAFSGKMPSALTEPQKARLLAAHIARGAAFMNVRILSVLDLARLALS